MAGADRIEGCIFGNGERTGNVDIVNLALNQYTQGISPKLDFSDIQACIDIVNHCNDLPVHPRHPYAGELVFTAFSGSHQDAIKKGFEMQAQRHAKASMRGEPCIWDMPYLPIDPADLGCNYEAVIRVNSQSGKGGIAYLIKQHLGLDLPRKMQVAFYKVIQAISEKEAREVTVEDITTAFRRTYYYGGPKYVGRLVLRSFKVTSEPRPEPSIQTGYESDEGADERKRFDGTISVDGVLRVIQGEGNGPLSALLNALKKYLEIDLVLREYTEHTIGDGQDAKAASFVELTSRGHENHSRPESWWGAGHDFDISGAGLRAVLSAVNNAIGDRPLPELKLTVGLNERSGQEDVASVILNSLQLELPRRLQASYFEVVQVACRSSGGEISYEEVKSLFCKTYGYLVPDTRFAFKSFTMEHVGDGSRRSVDGTFIFDGEHRRVTGEGNGPLSATLAALHSQISGTLSVREYSEHSIGEGTDVKAASYVELVYLPDGQQKKEISWGVALDEDITVSGVKAVLNAASALPVVINKK